MNSTATIINSNTMAPVEETKQMITNIRSPTSELDNPAKRRLVARDLVIRPSDYVKSAFKANGCDIEAVKTSSLESFKKPTEEMLNTCLLYTSPSPRDRTRSRMPSSA